MAGPPSLEEEPDPAPPPRGLKLVLDLRLGVHGDLQGFEPDPAPPPRGLKLNTSDFLALPEGHRPTGSPTSPHLRGD